jgi:hypothetical protein
VTGPTGPAGATGPAGPTGPTGPQGPTGPGNAVGALFADATGSSLPNPFVASISGGGGSGGTVPLNVTTLRFAQGQTGPALSQAQQANASAPQSMHIAPQPAGAAATNATNGTPGSLSVDIGATVNGGSSGYFNVTQGGNNFCGLGPFNNGVSSAGVLWLGTSSFPKSNANFVAYSDGFGTTLINVSSSSGSGIGQLTFGGGLSPLIWGSDGIQIGYNLAGKQFGSGLGVLGIGNANTVPSTNPAGGYVQYGATGAAQIRGSNGTVTTIAPA